YAVPQEGNTKRISASAETSTLGSHNRMFPLNFFICLSSPCSQNKSIIYSHSFDILPFSRNALPDPAVTFNRIKYPYQSLIKSMYNSCKKEKIVIFSNNSANIFFLA